MITEPASILKVQEANIPQAMKNARRWVCWQAIRKQRRDGAFEYTKEPRRGGDPTRRASSTDESTWCDFTLAYSSVLEGRATGVGFVLGDGWAGIDIDGACRDDVLREEAAELVAKFSTFAERSVSGTGVHLLLHGEVPRGIKTDRVEIYGEGRFFTVSGWRLEGAPATVEHRQPALDELIRELETQRMGIRLPGGAAVAAAGTVAEPPPPPPAGDDVIIEHAHRVCRRFPELWAGSTDEYEGDESRADLALAGCLAFMCGPGQSGLVRRLMECSGLRRSKWTTNHTYLERTIEKAYSGREVGDFYHWRTQSDHNRHTILVPTPATDAPLNHGRVLDLHDPSTVDDIGFARRLALASLDDIRYVSSWEKWIAWDGSRWVIDDGAAAIQQAQQLRDRLWHELAALPPAKRQQATAALRYIAACGSAKKIRDITILLKYQQAIRIDHGQLDRHPYLLNVYNGTLDLRTGALIPHDRRHFLTQQANVMYDAEATCELWDTFITDAMLGDEDLVNFLQVSSGLMLCGDVSRQVIWCHHGGGSNGKSTFLTSLTNLLGDYAVAAPPNFLMMRHSEGHPTEIAMLYGKRLVTAIECEGGKRMRESFVKVMTGGDKVAARRMREDFWMMDPTWHIHVAFNEPPTITGTDDGIRRRLRIVPWRANFKGPREDTSIKRRLESPELRSGILNWCLAGMRDFLTRGLPENPTVRAATDEYISEQDLLAQFIEEECIVEAGRTAVLFLFISRFHAWLDARGENTAPWSSKRVASDLKRRGFGSDKCHRGQYRNRSVHYGLSLINACYSN